MKDLKRVVTINNIKYNIMNKDKTYETKCRKCGESIYFYPRKLLLETNNQPEVSLDKRIITLTCCSGCHKTLDYEFPLEFNSIL